MSVCARSWHDNIHACALTHFVAYPLHKFGLTLSFSYLWLWNISVLTLCHVLSTDYVCVPLVHLFSFFFCLHAVQTFFRKIYLCLHVVSCRVSFFLHSGFDYFSSCLHVGLDSFLVWPNLNYISNNRVTEKKKIQVQIKMCNDKGNPFIATFHNVLSAQDMYYRFFLIFKLLNLGHNFFIKRGFMCT